MVKIKEFQRAHGLVPDGRIGEQTFNAFRLKYNMSDTGLAHFLGQVHHETGGFTFDTENLNYSVNSLKQTFSYYRNRPKEADADGRNWYKKADQETIANKVYWDKNRTTTGKLGNDAWGDGWKYRGRGAIQITGKWNYLDFAEWLEKKGYGTLNVVEQAATDFFWETALWFFEKRKIWKHTDKVEIKNIEAVTKLINGGLNGFDKRVEHTRIYAKLVV